ncbi:hypothetical protein RJT34_04836 [Clitoria ternatea]|uniref:ADP-ribosyl cyclase/cyclic ADP-ribose hydrolase n=1 Tax=Clitoria ternatea TaxID=43366 RepID=A0AAN9Q309_CLITE
MFASYEYELVQEIVNDIFTKVNLSFQTNRNSNTQSEGLVGIQKHIEQIQNMLQLDSPAVKIIGIWGIGGIGKSTIAAAAYHKLATQFQSSALVLDVQKEIERHGIYRGTDAMKCMFLDMCQIKEVQLGAETFKMMDNLRVLNFYDSDRIKDSNLHILSFLESLPDELRFLRWDSFPQRCLPLDFDPENLVELYMRNSKLEIFLERDQHLPNLKRLDLSRSLKLRQIPDLAVSPNIEQVILNHCEELSQVYSSAFLSKLNCILLKGCTNLRNLHIPSNVFSTSYGFMDLQDCSKLETFSVSMETMGVPLSGCSRNRRPRIYKAQAQRAKTPRPFLFEKVLRPSLLPSHKEVCMLNLSCCESLRSLPTHLCKLKFLRTLDLCGCSNLEKFPEIEEPMENLMELILDVTAIRELPLSLHHLVGLQKLSLSMCPMLEFIPPSIGSLTKLYKLDLTDCESLQTLPSSIFKLKLTKLSLQGCLMLRTFPDILEPLETFSEIILTKTAIKEVPPSMGYLVGLKTLRLNLCSDLELLPNSIVNLKHLSELDCSGCGKLTEIPNDIGRLSSLRELTLAGTGIIIIPESIAHLSSLKLLDLSDCKKLECIPQLPPFLKKLLACNCSSLRTVMPNSRIEKLPSDSKENVFEFRLTNSEELDLSGHSNIVADARHRITEDVYRSVLFCFPGNAVPDWFHCRGSGGSVTMITDFQNRRCSTNKLIGFALCVVLRPLDVDNTKYLFHDRFGWILKFASDDGKLVTVKNDHPTGSYYWKARGRYFVKDHTFVWKYLMESSNINHMFSHALKFTFEICSNPISAVVKECGICPLYSKEKDGNDGVGDSSNDTDEQRRSRVLHGNKRKWEKEELLLKTFPEILEPAEGFALISLTETGIKELPSSLENLVGLQTLQLNLCRDLELLPSTIELSLRESGIVNLPDSIGQLSSLKSLDLSDCKRLECIPQLPAYLKYMVAFDCPSIRRVSSSSFKVSSSDSHEGVFKFHLTNTQELDTSGQSNLAADAWLRITNDAYRSVLYCFPGSEVSHWFPNRCKGHSGTQRFVVDDHTFMWKYYWDYSSTTGQLLSGARNFTFEICKYDVGRFWPNNRPTFKGTEEEAIARSQRLVNFNYEYKLVQEIVNDIFTKVNLSFQTSSNTQSEGLVGIQKHIEQIQNMLQLDSPAVKIIGIWGIGGIGKSTLAAAAYHKLATQFQSSALVLDVQKEIERHGIYQGTDAVKCMFLDMCQIKEVQLDPQTFKMMDNLRVLNFYDSNRIQDSKLRIPSFLESLPDELRFLRWDGFPQGSLPVDFSPENLVELHMRDSKLEQLWERDQHLPNLKRLDLSGSRKLIQIPDLSGSPNIEEVILSQCKELIQVYSSCFLGKLNCIRLDGCTNLRSLNTPSNILSTLSGIIVLKGCCNLEMFSVSKETMGVTLSGCSHNRSSQKTKPSRQYLRNSQDSWISVGAYNKKDRGIVLAEKTNKSRSLFKNWSATFDPIDSADSYEEPWDSIHLPYLNVLRRSSPSLFPSLNELCRLNLSYCESLTSLPTDLCKLKFLRGLDLRGCSNLEKFPEIEEPMENLMVLILDETAIQELPLSLHLLVGLQELSLHMCRMLEFIPPSIGSLTKLSKLDLTYCESLETLPSSIFKLKLTKLDLRGCSRLRNFSEIMEPAESFADLRLTKTAIQKLPSSLDNLAGIQNLQLNLCRDFEFVPKSISNVTLLSKIDFSGCEKLSAIPSNIGRLSLLGELSLHGTGIVTLPESIVNLSSLKSLDLSDCKRLECIPQLPSFLKHFLAFDCPSIREVSHSRFNVSLSANSKEGVFKFYLTNCQELDASAQSNLAADAWIRITEDAHRSVFYCYPGNTVPHWFPYCCKGHSVTLKVDSLKWHEDKFIGFALCIVWGIEGINHERSKHGVFSYRFSFDCDDGTHIIASHDMLRNYFTWKGGRRFIEHGAHTFMWKYYLNPSFIWQFLSRAHDFTFEICMYGVGDFRPTYIAYDKVIECGISPLFRKEKDNDAGSDECFNFERFSNYDIGEPSGSKTAYKKAEEGTEDGC